MKNLRVLRLLLLLSIMSSVSSLMGQIIHVPTVQQTIQGAIDVAADGDTIIVQPGKYVENINFSGKNNILLGSLTAITGDTSYISQTMIDGGRNGVSVVTIENARTIKLTGLTITNGKAKRGGGIFCKSSTISLENLIIRNNVAEMTGGGIYISGSSSHATIDKVTVTNNSADFLGGGGINIWGGDAKIFLSNIILKGNTGENIGAGGIEILSSDVYMENALIVNNTGGMGGGIHVSDGFLKLIYMNNQLK